MVNPGFYRGLVIDNADPNSKGHCRIYVHGVYPGESVRNPEMIPWAEPVMPIFGGSGAAASGQKFTSTGWTSAPTIGSYVWVFFEGNDQNYPLYFAAIQGGDAWMSEHEMQHVLSTANFRITVDENPSASTTMLTDVMDGSKTNQQTRARIEIESDAVALDIVIKGDVNLYVDGSLFQKITGNRYTEISGDDVLVVDGNTTETHGGDLKSTRSGNSAKTIKGTDKKTVLKSKTVNVAQSSTDFVGGNYSLEAGGSNVQKAGGIHAHV